MKKKNVLVTGIGQINFISQLYGNIHPKLENFNFNSLNLNNFGSDNLHLDKNEVFKQNYRFDYKLNVLTLFKSFFHVLSNGYYWKDLRIALVQNGRKFFKKWFSLTQQHVFAYQYSKFIDNETDTDIIHLHYPNHANSLFLQYLTKEYFKIITYWGSDIYRIRTLYDHEIQNTTLRKVNVITVSTPEMKFLILTRFGFKLFNKIKTVRFIHNNSYYRIADNYINNNDWIENFKDSFKLPKNKIIVLFGHNAHKENNHLKFLLTLKELPDDLLEKYHIVFPLSYGDPEKVHIAELKKKSEAIPTSFTFLTDFLNWEDLAKLKIVSDIYIHAPTTDGLSAFLTEFFFTNNLAIIGAWLPYKTFRDLNLKYIEFEKFQDLKNILSEYLTNDILLDLTGNNRIIGNNFSADHIALEWIRIYKEIDTDLNE